MYVVVCYDIVENTPRARLLRLLRSRLQHVQKSVFEGEVAEEAWPAFLEQLQRTIDPAVDTIRVYWLCGRCAGRTEVVGSGVYVDIEDADEIL